MNEQKGTHRNKESTGAPKQKTIRVGIVNIGASIITNTILGAPYCKY